MLSYHERRLLERIETMTSIEDPEFADGLRTGFPRRPHEYRRWPALLLICVGVACILISIVSGAWVLAVVGAVALPAGGLAWPTRRLDRPSRAPGTSRWSRRRRTDRDS